MSRKKQKGILPRDFHETSTNTKGGSVDTAVDYGNSQSYTPEQVIRSRLHCLASWEDVQSFISKLIMTAVLLWILFGVLFGITPMQNNDMSPSISAGDLILYYRMQEKLRKEDVGIFEKDGEQYVGRIVGKGGESVEITEEAYLRVNGSMVVESDIFYTTPRYGDEIEYPVQLGEDQYFILCDYREGAKDSRYFGPVNQDEIKGKVITILRRSNL